MDKIQVLELYDREIRVKAEDPGADKETTAEVVRFISRSPHGAWVVFARLTEENIARVIEEQIAHFEALGRDFEWKIYSHDWPPDLAARLEKRGFELEEMEALAVLDLRTAPEKLFEPPKHDIQRLTTPERLSDVAQVEEKVWNEPFDWLAAELAESLQRSPEDVQVYAAYVDGIPVSAAWMHFYPGTHFASLWGGSTLAEYRGRGIYRDLVGVRAQQARQRGYRYLTVDASPMSRPILERLGFEVLTFTRPCVWKVNKQENPD